MNERHKLRSNRLKQIFTGRRRVFVLSASFPVVGLAVMSVMMATGGESGSSNTADEAVEVAAAASPAPLRAKADATAESTKKSTRTDQTSHTPHDGAPEMVEPTEPEASESAVNAELRVSPLSADDPRWGGDVRDVRPDLHEDIAGKLRATRDGDLRDSHDRGQFEAAGPSRVGEGGGADAPGGVDPGTTAAIGRPTPRAETDVEIAETEAEVAALEAVVAEEQADDLDPAFAVDNADLVEGRIKEYVNLRDGPSNDSNVLTVVPTDTVIEVQPLNQCVHFCEVVVDGQEGYIYKSFIGFEEGQAVAEGE